MNSKPATIAQSGTVNLPTVKPRGRRTTAPAGHPIDRHRFSVGDALTIMTYTGKTYDKVTVSAVDGRWITVIEEEAGWTRGYDTSLLSVLAGQAAARFGRGPETPGVGVIYPAAGGSHGITDSGVCVVCCHN